MDVQEQILGLAGKMSADVERILADYQGLDTPFRDTLTQSGDILTIHPSPGCRSLCAVDGARVNEKMYAADLLLAVATGSNGITGEEKPEIPPRVWGTIVENDTGNTRITQLAMACLEANLLMSAPHHIRILDGGFITPAIGVEEGLVSQRRASRNLIYTILRDDTMNPTEAFQHIYTPNPQRPIIAIPKSDTSSEYAHHLNSTHSTHIHLRDRFLATQVLRPGEMFAPLPLRNYTHYTLGHHPDLTKQQKRTLAPIMEAVQLLPALSEHHQLWFTYFKPARSNTVIRFEFLTPPHTNATETSMYLASILNSETRAPHMLEPYAQVVVDKKAKQISPATKALRNLIIQNLTDEEKSMYGHLLTQQYRT